VEIKELFCGPAKRARLKRNRYHFCGLNCGKY
jgi:hypothetical protein